LRNFTANALLLKKVLKISGVLLIILIGLIAVTALLIRTERVQNWLVDQATSRLSGMLKTEVSIKHVSISLFNRLNLEGALVRDRNKDTLLYAGALKVSVTDWFFLRNEAELKYIGLSDAVVNLSRSDTVWNYAFILDAFKAPKKKKDTTKTPIVFRLQRVEIDRIRILQRDGWYGRDMTISAKHLDLDADEINFDKKKIFVHELELKEPYFAISDYKGNRPPRPKKARVRPQYPANELRWNPDDWDILVDRLKLVNGTFRNDIETTRKPYPYFDGEHFEFYAINGEFRDLSWEKDTISAKAGISTRERSGLTVNSITTNISIDPAGIYLKDLEILTPHSRLGNAYSMRYEDFEEDMKDFLGRVKLEGNIRNSTLSSKDLAYFAPELKGLDKSVRLSGNVSGTITDLSARGFTVEYGKQTRLDGDIRLQGLPDIEKTLISFRSNDLRTSYADAVSFAPALGKIREPRLSEIGQIRFRGDFNGYIRDFKVKGDLSTSLGNIRSDIEMKLPRGRNPYYAGRLETNSFNLGRLLGNDELGNIAFKGSLKGNSFDPKDATADIDGKVASFNLNGYDFRNISLSGTLKNSEFKGEGSIDDPALDASFNGSFKLSNVKPEYRMLVDIRHSDLKAMKFTERDMNVFGTIRVDMSGKNIDDIMGEASFYDLAVGTKDQVYVFDTLNLTSQRDSTGKIIEIWNSEIQLSMSGNFRIKELGNTFNAYLSKYYPLYFKAPAKVPADQDFRFRAAFRNVDQYLPLFNPRMRGLDNSSLSGEINSFRKSFVLKARVPFLAYNKAELRDFILNGVGNMDSLRVFANARMITINDSLQIPGSMLNIISSRDLSDIRLTTSGNQTINSAQLAISVQNLRDGIKIFFNPSALVVNDKTWRIERNGQLTISKSFIDAEDIRIVNGEQELQISSLPSETGNSNDILVSLKKVNLGDLLPYVLKEPRIEGITSGDITIEDPYNRLNIYVNAQTEQTRFEGDSIGIISVNGNWNNRQKKATYFLNSANKGYAFDISGHVNLADSSSQTIDTDIDISTVKVDILEKYVGIIFPEMNGTGSGKLRISGPLKEPDITGSVKIKDGSVRVGYTQCAYSLVDPVIEFRPGMIDFGTIRVKDADGNEGQVKGQLTHRFFRNLGFNFSASSKKLLLLNTTKLDNNLFYGKAVGRVNFLFSGPENDMSLYVEGETVDSSKISIVTSGSSKEKGEVDYIVWREYGREMNLDSIYKPGSNLSIDLDLTANNLLKVDVILDELSGDIISAVGAGNMKIRTGTNETTTLNGRYNIERGNYNFNFQDIFKKPFTLDPGSGSYISWTGDPYDAEININATYLAERVRMSTLFNDPNSSTVSGVSSDILKEISDVAVICKLTGTLSQPNPAFQLLLPTNSPVKNNPTVDSKLKTINRDPLEVSKQATYLIVFKSFAPQAAIVASNMNTELFSTTISGVINSILANSVQNFFYKIFGSSVDVNFNYSRMLTDMSGTGTGSSSSTNYRENVSLQFIKSLLNDKLIITFGSDFNFSTSSRIGTGAQSFLFLPDVNVEYKITPDGKFRTSFFYRSSFDALSTSGRRDRTGGNISFRTEFDRIFASRRKED
jgi:hypothetical protein